MSSERAARGDTSRGALARAVLGALVWAAVVAFRAFGPNSFGPIEILFLLAPLVVVPLGLELLRLSGKIGETLLPLRVATILQPAGAVCAALAFWLEAGPLAASQAFVWLVICACIAMGGLLRLVRGGYRSPEGLCSTFACIYIAVGGVWLVLTRLGASPMHFAEPIVLLTAVHFHFTGFALPLIAGAMGARVNEIGRLARAIYRSSVVGILLGPAMLAGGYILGMEGLKLAAVLVLATSSLALSGLMARVLPLLQPRYARGLIAVSAVSLAAAMILAGVYEVGQYAEVYWLLIPQMARWHGTLNALGFTLCSLLGCVLADGVPS